MFHRESSDKFAEITKLNDENQKLNKGLKTSLDEIQSLKNNIGSKMDVVDDPNNPRTRQPSFR